MIQDSASFSSDLKELVTDVRENKVNCKELLEKVQSLAENTDRRSESSLQVRETQINGTLFQVGFNRWRLSYHSDVESEVIDVLENPI